MHSVVVRIFVGQTAFYARLKLIRCLSLYLLGSIEVFKNFARNRIVVFFKVKCLTFSSWLHQQKCNSKNSNRNHNHHKYSKQSAWWIVAYILPNNICWLWSFSNLAAMTFDQYLILWLHNVVWKLIAKANKRANRFLQFSFVLLEFLCQPLINLLYLHPVVIFYCNSSLCQDVEDVSIHKVKINVCDLN